MSFWKCDDLANINDAIKAILLSTTAIKTSYFVIIDKLVAEEHGFSMDDTEKGQTGYKGFENLHINMTELTYGKIGTLMTMLQKVVSNEKFIVKVETKKIKVLINEVIAADCLNKDIIHKDLLKDINKFFPETC